jgi:hypothetical protein
VHQIDHRQHVGHGHRVPLWNALPENPVVDTPAAHAAAVEIPQDRPQGAHPLHPQHHVETIERDHEQVEDEFFEADEDVGGAADAIAGDPITIGYPDR